MEVSEQSLESIMLFLGYYQNGSYEVVEIHFTIVCPISLTLNKKETEAST